MTGTPDTPPEPGRGIDPDVDLSTAGQRLELSASRWPVLGAISAGGMVGALARYGVHEAWPHRTGAFAWSTLTVNVTGCLLIGALMVLVGTVLSGRSLARPFLGVGVLGGYTTFSTYALDAQQSLDAGAVWTAVAGLAITLVAGVGAVWVGQATAALTLRRRHPAALAGETA